MGKFSRKSNKGKDYQSWHADFRTHDLLTRQRRRRMLAVRVWLGLSGENAIRDEHGIVPRKVRRDIAKKLRKRAAK